ncbi:paraquat-inducible protein A [Methylotenera sp.]|uniref:paraquat-inducible protein A n=1 Tax=Methylotenera sp. TaxID=2051956 RepID=UPI00248A73E5|nr:paraquat-inducible protein A [Methylotenera sp.]MDI1299821.1 paraquat-inducible protein A [Methylotenera sp.]
MTNKVRVNIAMQANAESNAEFISTKFKTVSSLAMLACHQCGKLWKDAQEGECCQHCNATLHRRKPDSLNRTWALLITACIMYIPANILPVMITSTFFDTHQDTILSGIIFFWVSGDWELAAIVFIASFLVPLLKLASLLILVISSQRQSVWRQLERAKLYRLLEIIGRWSMLDVFVVSLLVGLVQIQGFAQITAGVGIVAFGAVVVLTMLASLSFDPRLIWDTSNSLTSSPSAIVTDASYKSNAN